jgi:hypothetical protein
MKNINTYTKEEIHLFKKLNTPAKIQDYLNSIPFNFEKNGGTCYSPRQVVAQRTAHCVEGALLASAVLEYHGHKPLIVDLRATEKPYDYDHVIAVYTQNGAYGAVSKTNHGVLRYREPVYQSIRELVMSYFHEYFLNDTGYKTLREYSRPLDLNRFNALNWRTAEEQLFEIPEYLDTIKHYSILTRAQIKNLRPADVIERKIGEMVEYYK